MGTFWAVLGQANAPVFMVTCCSRSSQCGKSHGTDLVSGLTPELPEITACPQSVLPGTPLQRGLRGPLLQSVCRFPFLGCLCLLLRAMPTVLLCTCSLVSATPWTIAHQGPLSLEFSRPESWSGLPFPPPGDLPDPGIQPRSPASPALQVDSLSLSHWGNAQGFSKGSG